MTRRIAVAVALTLTTLLTAPAVAGTPSAPALVTLDDAMRVLRRFERGNAKNNTALSVEGQSAIEAPPVRLIDDATFRDVRNRGGASAGERGRFTQRKVFVPLQTEYPLQFLASVRVDDGTRQVLAFTRPAETDPWKVTSAAGIVGARVPELAEDGAGHAVRLDPDDAAALTVPTDELAAALAELWTQSASDHPPSSSQVFTAGPLTDGAVRSFVGELAARGIDGDVRLDFEPAPYPVVAYAATRGRALVLFAITVREAIRPSDGAVALVQPRSRSRFGGLVLPGRYASVSYERLELLAAVVPPAGDSRRVRVIGSYGGVIRAVATDSGAIA